MMHIKDILASIQPEKSYDEKNKFSRSKQEIGKACLFNYWDNKTGFKI